MPGAPGLDFETWDTANANPSFSTQYKGRVPHPCDVFWSQGWDTTKASSHPSFNLPLLPGAPGLDFETWDTTNADPSFSAQHKGRVPHPCDVFWSQVWDTTKASSHPSFNLPLLLVLALLSTPSLCSQQPPTPLVNSTPIAIIQLDSAHPDQAATVTGALEVSRGKAVIVASGTITSGSQTTQVTLPRRGVLRVCASTTVKLAADSSVPTGETPGLMMALDHGAIEASFATGRNSDVLMTPDFRIFISGPGSADVKVRLGQHGDTCVDNAGTNAPYVLVTGVFDAGDYRVQPGQRVMFERGNLHEVVDHEKEPCGCPPSTAKGNEFPLAQSEGLAPAPKPAPPAVTGSDAPAQPIEPLVYKSEDHTPQPVAEAIPAPTAAPATPEKKPAAKKKGSRIARFFRRLFGAE